MRNHCNSRRREFRHGRGYEIIFLAALLILIILGFLAFYFAIPILAKPLPKVGNKNLAVQL